MKTVGITGGIGSGKTTVAKMFTEKGIPVYIADTEAKKLMNTSSEIKEELIKLFGPKAYADEELNRSYIASEVFYDSDKLEKLNAIVHPRVGTHFSEWKIAQKAPYILYEAAILFEKGAYKKCDYTILVTAPKAIRIERIKKRDNTTEKAIEARMNNQWPDKQKEKLADFVIENNEGLAQTKLQVEQLHNKLLSLINS